MADKAKSKVTPIDSKWAWVPDFETPTYDRRGHFEHVNYKVPTGTQYAIKMVQEAHKDVTGWRNSSDFVRWAILLGLNYCEHQFKDEDFSEVNKRTNVIWSILVREQEQQRFDEMWTGAEQVIQKYLDTNLEGEAQSLALQLYEQIEGMEKGRHRVRWMEKIKGKFGRLLKGASLKNFKTGDDDDE